MDKTLRKVLAPSVEVSLPVDLVNNEVVYGTFKLAYDWRAVCAVKAATGKSMLDGAVWAVIEQDPEFVAVVLHAGLAAYQPELTLEEVMSMLVGSSWLEITQKIVEAWNAAKPKPRPTQESPKEPAAAQKA